MTSQLVLLRSVNVGGHRRLPMAELRAHLLALNARQAKTHFQSGNCVCRNADDPKGPAARIENCQGFRPGFYARDPAAWRSQLASDPFPDTEPRYVPPLFHDVGSAVPLAPLRDGATATERLASPLAIVWLHSPGGIGRSEVAVHMERRAGIRMSARAPKTGRSVNGLLEEMV